jgi:hypothetical protein
VTISASLARPAVACSRIERCKSDVSCVARDLRAQALRGLRDVVAIDQDAAAFEIEEAEQETTVDLPA